MAMGKRQQRQESLFIMADGLPKSAGHPFYQRLNALLAEANFDRWIERRCQQYYEQEEKRGQPSIPIRRALISGSLRGGVVKTRVRFRCRSLFGRREFFHRVARDLIPLLTTRQRENTAQNQQQTQQRRGAAGDVSERGSDARPHAVTL